jgi:hypothetical protein
MQKSRILTAVLLLTATALFSQVYERSIGLGFDTHPSVIRPMSGGRWLIAGKGEQEPGSIYADTIFIMVLDATGQVLIQQNLHTPSGEIRSVGDAVVLPDGSIAVAVKGSECDAIYGPSSLTVLNPDGTVRWVASLSNPDLYVWDPGRLFVAPDGNIFGVSNCYLTKYNAADGTVIWQNPFFNLIGCNPDDVKLVPGTEDLLFYLPNQLVRYKKIGTPLSPDYTIAQTWDFQSNFLERIFVVPDGHIYLPSNYSNANTLVYRINPSGLIDTITMPFKDWQDIYPVADGFYWLRYQNGQNHLLKTDFNLQQTSTITINNPNLIGMKVAVHGDTIGIAGYDYYGPYDNAYNPFKQQQGWFHSSWGAAVPTTQMVNAGAVKAEQVAPVKLQIYGAPPYFQISGGPFRVQVKNNGNTLLNQVALNTRFEYVGYGCPGQPAFHQVYNNLNMQPGDTRWLVIDSLVFRQYTVPSQICFWTSSPNDVPDADRSDDIACVDLVLGTNEPQISQLNPFPNPADAGFTVEFPDGTAVTRDYRMFDGTGRLVATGKLADREDRQYISTAALPEGMYWLRAGYFVAKVVVLRNY